MERRSRMLSSPRAAIGSHRSISRTSCMSSPEGLGHGPRGAGTFGREFSGWPGGRLPDREAGGCRREVVGQLSQHEAERDRTGSPSFTTNGPSPWRPPGPLRTQTTHAPSLRVAPLSGPRRRSLEPGEEVRLALAGERRGDDGVLGAFGQQTGGESVRHPNAPPSATSGAPCQAGPPPVPARTLAAAANAAAGCRPAPSPPARPTPAPPAPAPRTSPPSSPARSTRRESPPHATRETPGSPRPPGRAPPSSR